MLFRLSKIDYDDSYFFFITELLTSRKCPWKLILPESCSRYYFHSSTEYQKSGRSWKIHYSTNGGKVGFRDDAGDKSFLCVGFLRVKFCFCSECQGIVGYNGSSQPPSRRLHLSQTFHPYLLFFNFHQTPVLPPKSTNLNPKFIWLFTGKYYFKTSIWNLTNSSIYKWYWLLGT